MAVKLIKVNGIYDTNISVYEVDTEADKNGMDTSGIEQGSKVHIIETDKTYILDGQKQWSEIVENSTVNAENIVSATAAMTPEQAAQTRQNIGADTPETVTEWLNEHVDPDTGYVIDNSLTIQGAAADAKKVGDEISGLKNTVGNPVQSVYVASINLFDKTQIVTGEYLKDVGVGTGTSYSHSGIIDLKAGTYLFPSSVRTYGTWNGRIVCFYNNSDEKVSYQYATAIEDTDLLKIVLSADSRISFNIGINAADTTMLIKGEDENDWPESYVDYFNPYYKIEEDIHLSETMKSDIESFVNQNPLNGKIVSFNGDSICYGEGYAGGYGKIIADRNQMIYENIGRSGATICAETYVGPDNPRMWICRTVANMRSDADYVILEGGVNDAYSDASVGHISEGYIETLDDTKFAQAFEKMLRDALTRFPGKKIGYIAVHKVEHWSSLDNSEYSKYKVAMECCKKWGVPVCDLNDDCPPFALLNEYTSVGAAIRTAYTKNGDGWHPNEQGYKKYYCDKIEAWMKTL